MNTLIWDVRYIHATNLISDYIFITVKILKTMVMKKMFVICHFTCQVYVDIFFAKIVPSKMYACIM